MPAKGSSRACSHRTSFASDETKEAMNANPQFLAATARVDEAAVRPLPDSRKMHVEGSRPYIRVPVPVAGDPETAARELIRLFTS
jgi:hypothetical protein